MILPKQQWFISWRADPATDEGTAGTIPHSCPAVLSGNTGKEVCPPTCSFHRLKPFSQPFSTTISSSATRMDPETWGETWKQKDPDSNSRKEFNTSPFSLDLKLDDNLWLEVTFELQNVSGGI
jgi:hypothetical protein